MNSLLCRRSEFRRAATIALLSLLSVLPVTAQQMTSDVVTLSRRDHKHDNRNLSDASRPLPLRIDLNALARLTTGTIRLADVPLTWGTTVDLDLEEYSIVAPGARLEQTTDHGLLPLPLSTVRLFRGRAAGGSGGEAVLTISRSHIAGWVTLGGKTYDIMTDRSAPAVEGEIAAIAYPIADYNGAVMTCGLDDGTIGRYGIPWSKEDHEHLARSPRTLQGRDDTVLYMVKGAFEADYEYRQMFGSLTEATDYMMQTIALVSAIYERDLNCQLLIGYLNIYETPTQPYTRSPASGPMSAALDEARGHWNTDPAKRSVDRGFTHIFSGKGWQGIIGIAFVNVLCQKDICVGYSSITRTNPDLDILVVAHELGHNFGSVHTHSCSWNPAIDSCTTAEGGSCYAAADIHPTLGTVMAYCGQKERKFGTKISDFLRTKLKSGLGCVILARRLTVDPPLITLPTIKVNERTDSTIVDFYSNNSRDTVWVLSQEITGLNSERFTVVEPTEFPFPVAPGTSSRFHISYSSDVDVPSLCTLTVTHTGLNPSISVGLEAYAEDLQPRLGFNAGVRSEVNFGSIRVGESRDTAMGKFYLNLGTAELRATETELTGPGRFDFQIIAGSAPFTLPSGSPLKGAATFRYAPQAEGNDTAWLRVRSNSRGGGIDSVALVGNARSGPLLRFSTDARWLDFRERSRNVTYDTAFAWFFNGGSDTLFLYTSIEGPQANDFTVNLGIVELPPGSGDSLRVTLRSDSNGVRLGTLVLENLDPDMGTLFSRDTIRLVAYVGVPAAGIDHEATASGVDIRPNPIHERGSVSILPREGESGEFFTLKVINLRGEEILVRRERFGSDGAAVSILLHDLPVGRYYLRIDGPGGKRSAQLTVAR